MSSGKLVSYKESIQVCLHMLVQIHVHFLSKQNIIIHSPAHLLLDMVYSWAQEPKRDENARSVGKSPIVSFTKLLGVRSRSSIPIPKEITKRNSKSKHVNISSWTHESMIYWPNMIYINCSTPPHQFSNVGLFNTIQMCISTIFPFLTDRTMKANNVRLPNTIHPCILTIFPFLPWPNHEGYHWEHIGQHISYRKVLKSPSSNPLTYWGGSTFTKFKQMSYEPIKIY